MPVTVKFSSDFGMPDGMREVAVEAHTPADALRAVAKKYPAIKPYFLNSAGGVRSSLAFFKNSKQVRENDTLADGAVVEVIASISGGSSNPSADRFSQ